MRLSKMLSFYIGRHFLLSFAVIFALFMFLILIFDAVELLRRSAARPDVSFALVMEMALLKLPYMGQQVLPFAIFFGGMNAFWRLTRSHELVITRSAGVSAWQFLFPVITLAVLLGGFQITVLNPLSSTILTRFERLESTLLKGHKSFLALSKGGLWLRQFNAEGQSVVHSDFILQSGKDVKLRNVIVFNYEGTDKFLNRIDDTIVFHSLDEEQLAVIIDIQLRAVAKRLEAQQLTLEISDEAKRHLAREGYDPQFGARPLKRTIQEQLLNPLATRLLDGDFKPGDHIRVRLASDELTFEA